MPKAGRKTKGGSGGGTGTKPMKTNKSVPIVAKTKSTSGKGQARKKKAVRSGAHAKQKASELREGSGTCRPMTEAELLEQKRMRAERVAKADAEHRAEIVAWKRKMAEQDAKDKASHRATLEAWEKKYAGTPILFGCAGGAGTSAGSR